MSWSSRRGASAATTSRPPVRTWRGWRRSIAALPAVGLIAINGFWISILLGMLSARFRDVPPIVASLLQVGFFLTPVFWPIEALRDWAPIAAFNPIFAAIDVVRAPLLGIPPGADSWTILLISTVPLIAGSVVCALASSA